MAKKNISIKQDGTTGSFSNISVVGVRSDFGSGDYIPIENTATALKNISKNGDYKAKDRDNVSGYTAVFVNVPRKKITGVDRNDGHTYEISINAQGNITRTLIE